MKKSTAQSRKRDRKLVSSQPWEIYYTNKGWFYLGEHLHKEEFMAIKGKLRSREKIEAALIKAGCQYRKPTRGTKTKN